MDPQTDLKQTEKRIDSLKYKMDRYTDLKQTDRQNDPLKLVRQKDQQNRHLKQRNSQQTSELENLIYTENLVNQ